MSKKVYTIEETEQKKPLFLVMQKVWFDEVESGEKKTEYREDTEFYKSRLLTKDRTAIKNYKTLIMQEGYNPGARRMILEITGVTYLVRDEFQIHLGEIIERQNFDRTNVPKRKPSDKPRKPRTPKKKPKTLQSKLISRRTIISKNYKGEDMKINYNLTKE